MRWHFIRYIWYFQCHIVTVTSLQRLFYQEIFESLRNIHPWGAGKVLFKQFCSTASGSFKAVIVSTEIWQLPFHQRRSVLFDVTLSVECHWRLHFTLITVSLIGMKGLEGQPSREYLKSLICASSEKAGDPCSSFLSFTVLCLEPTCSCPCLFTAESIHTGKTSTSHVCLNSS